MDDEWLIVIVLALAVLGGCLAGWVAFFKQRALRLRVDELEELFQQAKRETQTEQRKLAKLQKDFLKYKNQTPSTAHSSPPEESKVEKVPEATSPPDEALASEPIAAEPSAQPSKPTPPPQFVPPPVKPAEPPRPTPWEVGLDHLKVNWMVWLGGLCVALSGIFLVRYSIEQGLLGPTARVVSGVLLGLALHGVALWLARRQGEVHSALAALAGAGSVTIYAAFLAALRLYDLIPINLGFALLALTAMGTMWLALYYGPVLTAIGILGSYAVPPLLGSNAEPTALLLVYSALVTFSALGVMRYVYRHWLWVGMLVGILIWWALMLLQGGMTTALAIYLAAIGYAMLAIPSGNWKLQQGFLYEGEFAFKAHLRDLWGSDLTPRGLRLTSLLLLLLASAVTLWQSSGEQPNLWVALLMPALLIFASLRREDVCLLPWAALLVHILAVLARQLDMDDQGLSLNLIEASSARWWWGCWALLALLFSGSAWLNYQWHRSKAVWASLLCSAPLLLFCLAYLVSHSPGSQGIWTIIALGFGLVYLGLARQFLAELRHHVLDIWLFICGHLAYSAAVAIYLNHASFTIAIALQLISLSWVIRRFELPELAWLLKVVAALVVARLTLHPWLFRESDELIWLVVAFGGSCGCAVAGVRLLAAYQRFREWMECVSAHLLVLTIWCLSRYFLYQGEPFAGRFEATESALNLCLFGALAMIYQWRSLHSQYLQQFYLVYSAVLAVGAAADYALILGALLLSEGWLWREVGEQPLFNLMLPALAGPMVLSLVGLRYLHRQWRAPFAALLGVSGFIFVSMQIRHLWQGTVRLDTGVLQGELYTYSAVWLLLAVVAMLWGSQRFGPWCYRGGLGLLGLVIIKLFLIDLSGLDGLLRVASFMGLGLCLLGVAFLHQRLAASHHERQIPDQTK